ncbi:RHS repeat-associated core domain-containing protein [Rapidithrix thailandica]|uniref:RHS repeat-associated core domain-containing protein n=1 Tax=Rapidithrix thailandica TaxID=413964 RepID=A0AAW9S449_9BACT
MNFHLWALSFYYTFWQAELDIYGKIRTLAKGSIQDCSFRYQGQYEDAETGLYYNHFRYYSPESGTYISQDPIGLLSGKVNFYAYVFDSISLVDPLGLDELVYQLLNKDGDVVYYGITERSASKRLKEHLNNPDKKGKFARMEVLADNLTHDQARSIEGALIRKRLRERADDWSDFDSIEDRLGKSDLLNKNRGRVKDRWLSDNPLKGLKDKMHKKPKKVSCG